MEDFYLGLKGAGYLFSTLSEEASRASDILTRPWRCMLLDRSRPRLTPLQRACIRYLDTILHLLLYDLLDIRYEDLLTCLTASLLLYCMHIIYEIQETDAMQIIVAHVNTEHRTPALKV